MLGYTYLDRNSAKDGRLKGPKNLLDAISAVNMHKTRLKRFES